MNIHIVGCGDIGIRVARRYRDRGEAVVGWVRSPERAKVLAGEGVEPQVRDLDKRPPAIDAERIFWFAPPPRLGVSEPRLRSWLDQLNAGQRRLVYISTSGVYGDCGQRWIDEDEPLKPATDRARRRLDAEQALQEMPLGMLDAIVLRVPGIYGPGRLPIKRLQQQLPVVDEPDAPRWTNRIHAEDLADVALAAMDRGVPGRCYNVSDGHPSTMCDYFTRCAKLLNLPEPPRIRLAEAEQKLTPQLLSFLEESRRMSNRRMIEELGIHPRYSDLESGLPACL